MFAVLLCRFWCLFISANAANAVTIAAINRCYHTAAAVAAVAALAATVVVVLLCRTFGWNVIQHVECMWCVL